MRIGIDIRNIGKKRTGDEAVFFSYVKNLALIDSENKYLLFTDIAEEEILDKIKNDLEIKNKPNFSLIPLLAVGQLRNKFIWNMWTLPRYLQKNPLDVYHTQYILPFFTPKKIKLLTTIHDISFNFYPQFIKFSDLFFLKLLIPRSLKRADGIIAVSDFTKNEIIKFYKVAPEKITVAYNAAGDSFASFDYSEDKLGAIRKKYNLPEKFILYLGTMQPRKNLPVLIKAYAKIKKNIPELKLVLAGNKNAHNFDKKIDAKIEKYNLENDVIFTGYIEEGDKPVVYRLADLFVFPSLYEGFGMPILEAMASGTAVIASDIAPHREIAGSAAIYFYPKKAKELSRKIEDFFADENLGKNLMVRGQEQVEKFSWKKTASTILSVYQKVLKTTRVDQ